MAVRPPLLAIRIKDGIFVGNRTSSEDEDFLIQNKVSHIVNCAGGEIPNLYHAAGIMYLTFHWRDVPQQRLLDERGQEVQRLEQFVDSALAKGECCLIHGACGVNRSCAAMAAYLMSKYGWQCNNTISFMELAHPDMDVKPYFIRQLRAIGERLQGSSSAVDVFHPDLDTTNFCLDNEQWALRNTYLNALPYDHARNARLRQEVEAASAGVKRKKGRRIVWSPLPLPGDGHDPEEPMAPGPPVTKRVAPERSLLLMPPAPVLHALQHPHGITCTKGPWHLLRDGQRTIAAPAPAAAAPAATRVPPSATQSAAAQAAYHADPYLAASSGHTAPPMPCATRHSAPQPPPTAAALAAEAAAEEPQRNGNSLPQPRPAGAAAAASGEPGGRVAAPGTPNQPSDAYMRRPGSAPQRSNRGAFASIGARKGSPLHRRPQDAFGGRQLGSTTSAGGHYVPAIARIQALHGISAPQPPGRGSATYGPPSGTQMSPRAVPPKRGSATPPRAASPHQLSRRGSLGGRDSPTRDVGGVRTAHSSADGSQALRRVAAASSGGGQRGGGLSATGSPIGSPRGLLRPGGSAGFPRPADRNSPFRGTQRAPPTLQGNAAHRAADSPLPDGRGSQTQAVPAALRRVAAGASPRDSPRRTNSPSDRLMRQTQASASRRRNSLKTA
eukprot:TRINITY_DN17171_c0_g1_i1.p1 TRINITY_DN17171_c0_g1~~TRINITY_DN17171_c0_g1_i1.p1  ORF type:complete len:668 (+),score=101.30 TRINITY_DN17171_c0_g1_i1:104-2107(+)